MLYFPTRDRDGMTWEDLHGVTAEELNEITLEKYGCEPRGNGVAADQGETGATVYGDVQPHDGHHRRAVGGGIPPEPLATEGAGALTTFAKACRLKEDLKEQARRHEVDAYFKENKAYIVHLMEKDYAQKG